MRSNWRRGVLRLHGSFKAFKISVLLLEISKKKERGALASVGIRVIVELALTPHGQAKSF